MTKPWWSVGAFGDLAERAVKELTGAGFTARVNPEHAGDVEIQSHNPQRVQAARAALVDIKLGQ